MEDLAGKVALVTGAGSGIGRGVALACAAAGMDVVLADVEAGTAAAVAAEVERLEVRALAVELDVRDAAAYEALAAQVYEEFGELNLLVNNAGVLTAGPVSQATAADWEWTFGVNLFGVIHGVNAFLPRLRAQAGPAHIVITASMAGLRLNDIVPLGVYSSSKHAVLAYAESLHDELAAEGIGVSTLCPGGVRTLIGSAERNRPAEYGGPTEEEAFGFGGTGNSSVMDPEEVGRIVLSGVQHNRRLILSHPELRRQVVVRYERMMDDFEFFGSVKQALRASDLTQADASSTTSEGDGGGA